MTGNRRSRSIQKAAALASIATLLSMMGSQAAFARNTSRIRARGQVNNDINTESVNRQRNNIRQNGGLLTSQNARIRNRGDSNATSVVLSNAQNNISVIQQD